MGNLKMKYNTMIITGSNGATASELIRYFSTITDQVIGISRKPAVEFTQSNVEIITADMTNDGLVNVLDIVALVNIILNP